MFYSKEKYGTPTLFWTRTILDVRSLAGRRNDMGRTRVPRRPNTLINDREPIAGHSDEARHTDRRFHSVCGGDRCNCMHDLSESPPNPTG